MKRFLTVLFLVLSCASAWTQGLEDWYAAVSEAAGLDQNAGLTTFLTLIIPPGGMYQGMATAYSAVVKDSGYLEANPAGSALLKDTELSVYHNDWIGDSRLEGVVFTIRQGDLGLGAGAKLLYIPFDAVDNWGNRYMNSWSNSYAKGYYTEFIGTLNAAYTFFGNYYFHGVTLGTNLKFAQRGVPDAIARDQSAIGVMADFGALTKVNFAKFYPSRERNMAFSAVLKNIGPPVMGDPLPSSFVLGMAYSPIRPLTLSVDGTFPMNLKDSALSESPSVATGMNLAMTTFWAIQSGIDFKIGRPRATMGSTVSLDKLTLNVSYVIDLMTTVGLPDRLAVEVKIDLGDLGRQEAEDRARELYLNGLDAYAKGNLEEAVAQWDKALQILPTFLPAKELRDTAQKAIELRNRMQDNQKIE